MFRSWEAELREVPSPISVVSAHSQQRKVSFRQPLCDVEQKDSYDTTFLNLQSSSTETDNSQKPSIKKMPAAGEQIVKQQPFGFHRKWLPVENHYPYE